MEPRDAEKKVLMDEKSPTPLTHRSRIPPPKRSNTPLIVGIIVLIIFLIIGVIIFFLLRGTDTESSKSGNQKSGSAKISPTPSLYQLVTIEIKKQQASLSAIENDIKELDSVFKYESVKFSDILTATAPQTAEWEAQKIDIAKAQAELEIVLRISSLNKLTAKINSTRKLSSIQKSVLLSEVNAHIAYLTSLKQTVAKETNFQALVGLANTISSDAFKSYAVIVPKVSIVVISDKVNVLNDSFISLANKLIQKTEELRSSKKDVTSVQKTLGHMLFLMGDAANRAETAVVIVFPLTPEGYPKNKSILLDAKSRLQKSSKNLKTASMDEQKIVRSLSAIESGRSQTNFFQFFQLTPQ